MSAEPGEEHPGDDSEARALPGPPLEMLRHARSPSLPSTAWPLCTATFSVASGTAVRNRPTLGTGGTVTWGRSRSGPPVTSPGTSAESGGLAPNDVGLPASTALSPPGPSGHDRPCPGPAVSWEERFRLRRAARKARNRAGPRCARCDVGGRILRPQLGVGGVVALAREDRGQARSPHPLRCGQDAQLVIHQDVVTGRVAPLDVLGAVRPRVLRRRARA